MVSFCSATRPFFSAQALTLEYSELAWRYHASAGKLLLGEFNDFERRALVGHDDSISSVSFLALSTNDSGEPLQTKSRCQAVKASSVTSPGSPGQKLEFLMGLCKDAGV